MAHDRFFEAQQTNRLGTGSMSHPHLVLNGVGEDVVWIPDSRVWMATAVRLAGEEVGEAGLATGEQNVAICCAGIAFELALKALVKISGADVIPSHRVCKVFSRLNAAHKKELNEYIRAEFRWNAPGFMRYMDEFVCHPDRKYSMLHKDGTVDPLPFGMPVREIEKVHAKILDLHTEEFQKKYPT